MDADRITEIGLDRGPCFGPCPVFRFTARRAGTYEYEGYRHIEPLGPRGGTFPAYLFSRLAEVCVELRVPELDDHYPCDFDDAATAVVTVRHAGGVKTVRNDNGGLGPVRHWAFAVLVEVVMREAFFIEDRKAGRIGR